MKNREYLRKIYPDTVRSEHAKSYANQVKIMIKFDYSTCTSTSTIVQVLVILKIQPVGNNLKVLSAKSKILNPIASVELIMMAPEIRT